MHKQLLAAALAATLATGAARADDDSEGEVRKIDRDAGKITLKHGEIKPLDMPPMTMVFEVRDKALLDGLKPGDKVRFRAVQEGGKVRLTEIRPAR
jgi:Cu(I)/Ag(I) efflux system periplasmic protein CusF